MAAQTTQTFSGDLKRDIHRERREAWAEVFRRDVGRRLAAARQAAGLSQAVIAERLGHSQCAHISEWENGKRLPGPEKLALMIEAYGTTADYIFGRTDDPDPDPAHGVHRLVAAQIQAQVSLLCANMARVNTQTVRDMGATHGEVLTLCRNILEAHAAMQKARASDGGWFDDDVRGGAALVSRLAAAADLAQAAVAKIHQARGKLKVRAPGADGAQMSFSLFTGAEE